MKSILWLARYQMEAYRVLEMKCLIWAVVQMVDGLVSCSGLIGRNHLRGTTSRSPDTPTPQVLLTRRI